MQIIQQRPKWSTPKRNLQIGDLVVIHDKLVTPMQWRLGRIIDYFPGPDNLTRVVAIRTKDGEVKRPMSKVSLILPGVEDVQQ